MTQKDKLIKAKTIGFRMKNLASSIDYDGKDYGCTWHKEHVRALIEMANELLKL